MFKYAENIKNIYQTRTQSTQLRAHCQRRGHFIAVLYR